MTNMKQEVMKDPVVHTFTKDIIKEAQHHDSLDAIYDVELALKVLRAEYNAFVNKF